MTVVKRKLKDFDFSGENHGVALVSKNVGGPANGVRTLVMKGNDVKVEMTMAEFLSRFFNLWSGDAAFIANLLGYSSDTDGLWDESKLSEQVTLMKSMQSGEIEVDTAKIADVIKSIAEKNSVELTDYVADRVSPVSKSKNETLEDDENMANQDLANELVELKKQRDEMTDLINGLREEVNVFKQRDEAEERERNLELAKGYMALGVEEDQVETLAKALGKIAKDEDLEILKSVLGTAVKRVENLQTEVTKSVTGTEAQEEEENDTDGVMKVIKSMKNS